MEIFSSGVKHNPEDDSSILTDPELKLYRDGILDWTVTAQTGAVYKQGQQVQLQQRVVIASADGETTLKTPLLDVFPNKKLAKTDKPVTLLNPNGFTRSIGLNANLNNKRIDLLEQVRGQYQGVLSEDEQ